MSGLLTPARHERDGEQVLAGSKGLRHTRAMERASFNQKWKGTKSSSGPSQEKESEQ